MIKNKDLEIIAKKLEKLPEEEIVFVKKLFAKYLSVENLWEHHLTSLEQSLTLFFNSKISKFLFAVIFTKIDMKKAGLTKGKYPKLMKLIKEMRALYLPALQNVQLKTFWPSGIRSVSILTTLEPESGESVHTIILFTNEDKKYEFRQPLPITLRVLNDIIRATNISVDELKQANIKQICDKDLLKSLKKELTNLKKNLTELEKINNEK